MVSRNGKHFLWFPFKYVYLSEYLEKLETRLINLKQTQTPSVDVILNKKYIIYKLNNEEKRVNNYLLNLY